MSLIQKGFQYDYRIVDANGNTIAAGEPVNNLIPNGGMDYIAARIIGTVGIGVSTWYGGVFEADYVPDASVTPADLAGVVGESTAYSGINRPAMTLAYDSVEKEISNADSPAIFTFEQESTLYGAFIASTQERGNSLGLILSIARFASPQVVPEGAEFTLTARMTLGSV